MKIGRSRPIAAGTACLLLLLAGCAVEGQEDLPESAAEREDVFWWQPSQVGEVAPAGLMPVAAERVAKGSGVIRYQGTDYTLEASQEELLLAYLALYYQSLADLEACDPAPLFAPDAQDRAATRKGVWETMIAVRGAQDTDLSLTSYNFTLTCTGLSWDGGDLAVSASEDAVQNFAALPGVDSRTMNVRHRFTLTETGEGWKLRSHSQMDSANMLAAGRNARGSDGGTSDSGAYLNERREEILSWHRQQLTQRRQQAASYDLDTPTGLTWEYSYDRDTAVAYALEWAGARNAASWPTYDRNGGNCQNYTSQCLLAGGIPMDHTGASQWKWYGDSPNTAQTASGRSASWSGVKEFYTYASNNTGYGLVAETGANFWAGEAGDLIQLGYEDNWRHVVIITQVIRDGNGTPVDYLVGSNTADLLHYPVSAYLYPQQRLIKIHGWNGR